MTYVGGLALCHCEPESRGNLHPVFGQDCFVTLAMIPFPVGAKLKPLQLP